MKYLNKILMTGLLVTMCICFVSCKSKQVQISSSNMEQLSILNSEGESFKLNMLDNEYTIIIKADEINEIIMDNIPQLVEIFNVLGVNLAFLWNEEHHIKEEVIKANSYVVDENMNLDNLNLFVLYNKDTVLSATNSIDDVIDELIQIIQDSSEMESAFLQKLSEEKSVTELRSNRKEILYLFITENCSMCEQVKEQILTNNKLVARFNKIIYVADHNSENYFSDSFNVYSRYFSISEFPTILVYSLTSQQYETNPQDIIDELQ